MKKNIIIGVLALVSVLATAFGVQQKIRADKNEALAHENEKRALQLMEEVRLAADDAQRQRMLAEANLVEAMRQRELAKGKSSD